MKSVMLSIRPTWCEEIASGEKTIEVRKTKPKLETPFKCYIDPKMQPEPKALAGVSDMTQREVNRLLKGIAEKEQCRVSVKEDKAELLTMEQWEAAVRAIRKELGEEEQDE